MFAEKMEDSAKAAADDRHDEVPRRAAAAPSLGRLPSPRAAALVACTLLASWALGQLLLVAPAKAALTQAQHVLLQAEREELAAQTAALRERRAVERLETRLRTVASDARRMRDAEAHAHAQLDLLDASRRTAFSLPRTSRSRAGAVRLEGS